MACTNAHQCYRDKLLKPDTAPQGSVTVTWMGTAGLYISDGKNSFYIDPFVSRYGIFKVGLGFPLPPMKEAIQAWVRKTSRGRADAVLVSHSHYDHSMDAPFFATFAQARLIGSESTAMIGRGTGLAEDRIQVVRPGNGVQLGAFRITFLKSCHSKVLFGQVPWPGEVAVPLVSPAAASDYRLGQTFSIFVQHPKGTFIHHGSAACLENMFTGKTADVVFLTIASRESSRDLFDNMYFPLQARMLIPIHFDNFFKPLTAEMDFVYGVDFPEFCETAAQSEKPVHIATLPIGQPVVLFP